MADDIAQRAAAFLAARAEGIVAAYLFGSGARGEARPDSDVDIGLLFATAPELTLAGQPYALAGDLERELSRPVDLVVLNDAPVDLAIRVLRDGRLMFERDRSARIRFEVRTRNEAFDLEPILRRYRSPRRASA